MNKEIQPIQVGDITIKSDRNIYMAGPCAVEGEEVFSIAQAVTHEGAQFLRGGAFKPRTNPESFQGLGMEGLRLLFEAGRQVGVPVVTEVMDASQIQLIQKLAQNHPFIFQIGSRNAQNYSLLTSIGETGVPVLLKRGKGSTVNEMLGAAGYVTKGGSPVLMCERGIVTFSSGDPNQNTGRFTADHLAILQFQEAGFLTVFDPSHSAGLNKYVTRLALSAIAVGANGLIVEVHNDPQNALCDKEQAITFDQFHDLIQQAKAIETALKGNV